MDLFNNASFVIGNNWFWLACALAFGLYFGWSTCERVVSHATKHNHR
jgi:hypothetical protein